MHRLFGNRPKVDEASRKDEHDVAAQLASSLDRLNLQSSPLVPPKRQSNTLNRASSSIPPFPGGFHPTLAISSDAPGGPSNGHHNDSRPPAPAFPQAEQYAQPGPLPVPPAMPIPLYTEIPPMSMTMQYALAGAQNNGHQPAPMPPRANHLRPPVPPKLPARPVSDPPPQITSESISAGPRPTAKRHKDDQLAAPATVANGARPAPRRRSSSTVSAPASPTSTRSSSQGGTVQCSGFTKEGRRCGRPVKKTIALGVLQPDINDELPVYCFQHSRQIQGNTYKVLRGEPVAFDGRYTYNLI